MRHVAISALCVLVLACSKDEPQQAGVRVEVAYTASFKTGCIIVRTVDAANVELDRYEFTDLANNVDTVNVKVKFVDPTELSRVNAVRTKHLKLAPLGRPLREDEGLGALLASLRSEA